MKFSKNTLLTTAAFVLPLVGLAALIISMQTPKKEDAPKPPPGVELGKAEPQEAPHPLRERIKRRIAELDAMTQEQWEEEGRRMGARAKNRAPTLEEARKRNRERLAALEAQLSGDKDKAVMVLPSKEEREAIARNAKNARRQDREIQVDN